MLLNTLSTETAKTYQLLVTDNHIWQTLENSQIFAWDRKVLLITLINKDGRLLIIIMKTLKQSEIINEHSGAIKAAIYVEMEDQKFIWTGDTNGRINIWTNVCF